MSVVTIRTCSRGHVFKRSSACPVCPKCWPGRYRPKLQNDFPEKLAAPALRALANAHITQLVQLAKYTEVELLALHGIGPNALSKLKAALKAQGMALKASRK